MATNPFQQTQPFPPTFRQGPQMGHAGAMRPNQMPGQMFGNFPQLPQRGRRRQAQDPGQQIGGPGGYQSHFTGAGQPPQAKGGQFMGGPGGDQTHMTGTGMPPGQNPFAGGSFDETPSFTGSGMPPGGMGPGYLWGEGAENPLLQQMQDPGPDRTSFGGSPNPFGAIGGPTQMGSATSFNNPLSGMNFNIPMPSAGMIGGALGGMAGGLPGAFLGNRASNWLADRFGWGQGGEQLTDSPSPFMPGWLGGGGDSSLDDPNQFNMTAPGNLNPLGPNGNRMTGMGSYRSRAGNVSGQIDPGSFAGMIDPVGGGLEPVQAGMVGGQWTRR